MQPIIKPLAAEREIEEMTEEVLGDADDKRIKNFIRLLENFADEDAEDACHLVRAAQRYAYTKSLAFDDAFRAFAGLEDNSSAGALSAKVQNFSREQ